MRPAAGEGTAVAGSITSDFQLRRRVSTLRRNEQFSVAKKYQLVLICNVFLKAFQAYDEGSIPFTRSNVFNSRIQLPSA